jgi:hypothetical protein
MSEEQIAVLAHMAGLKIDPAYIPGVLRNLEIVLAQGKVLAQAPLGPLVEPAPVFHP